MRNLEPKRARWIRVRIATLAVFLFAGAGAVLYRAHNLQIVQGAALHQMAEEQYLREVRLSPKRGIIYDRHRAPLAVSVEVESVWANPRQLRAAGRDPAATAVQLSAILGVEADMLARRLASSRQFVWIERRVTPSEAAQVRALQIPGVSMSPESRRYYPNRELAAHVLGFADVDGVGIEGLERSYEEQLRGSVRTVAALRDGRRHVVFSEQLLDDRATQGDDLVLTLDKTIQHVAEHELEMAVHTFEARAGSVVVMDPNTGEILALANYPSFNPNAPGDAPVHARRNRAITDRFEPGSTIKVFTVAGALAAGAVGPEQAIDCGHGAMQVAEYTIHDSHPWDVLTPAQILAHSSNIGTAKIGGALGRPGLFRVLRRFGFGENTGVPLPGETAGILRHHRRWYEMDAATISFGQGMSTTTLQLAVAMGAIANGGRLMEPVLVRRVTDAAGETVEEHLPTLRRQVVPQGTARLVADMLTAVTGPGGTGVEAAIEGYLVAGKTGTAQKADYVTGGYARDQWTASFVGFVPADRPRLVIAVVIDEPLIEHYGGMVAGPVFRRVGETALRHLGVPASTGGGALVRARARAVERAARTAEQAHAEAAEGPGIALRITPGDGEVAVPDVVGATARAGIVRLVAAGLVPEVVGSGVVQQQLPSPGDVVLRGETVRMVLAQPSFPADEPPVDPPAEGRVAEARVTQRRAPNEPRAPERRTP